MIEVPREVALANIPDTPPTLDFRALALDPKARVYCSGGGLLLVEGPDFVGAVGEVLPADAAHLCRERGKVREFLADERAKEALVGLLAFETAFIFERESAWRPGSFARPDVTIRALDCCESLGRLPDELRREIDDARAEVPVFAALVDGRPISFSYSSSMTETLADTSIDTLQEFRNQGFGAATCSALFDWVVQTGRAPIWGAVADNAASLALAAKLGFRRPAGQLYVAQDVTIN